jgi:transcriptional regulator GlxA family with amidase domain
VPIRRLGGQSQFSTLIALQRPEARFAELLHQVRSDLAGDHGVEALAERAGMSARNFARQFLAETGMSPAKAVERLRCESAQAMLHGGASVKETARACGFGDQERMRRAFRRSFGTAPAAFKFSPTMS